MMYRYMIYYSILLSCNVDEPLDFDSGSSSRLFRHRRDRQRTLRGRRTSVLFRHVVLARRDRGVGVFRALDDCSLRPSE